MKFLILLKKDGHKCYPAFSTNERLQFDMFFQDNINWTLWETKFQKTKLKKFNENHKIHEFIFHDVKFVPNSQDLQNTNTKKKKLFFAIGALKSRQGLYTQKCPSRVFKTYNQS